MATLFGLDPGHTETSPAGGPIAVTDEAYRYGIARVAGASWLVPGEYITP